MNTARLKAVGKLLLVLGAPIGFVLALFGSGVYCGVQNRYQVTSLERDVLGLDVEVPPDPRATTPPSTTPAPQPTSTTPPPTTTPPAPAPTPTPEPTPTPLPEKPTAVEPT